MLDNEVNFLDYFRNIPDPRINRKKLYPLDEMLLVTICSVICGAEGWSDISLFGKEKIDYLKGILPFNNGVATDDTFRRFFRALDTEAFKGSFIKWTESLSSLKPGFVSIDGKTLRRSHDKASGKEAIHMVSAWCSEQGIVLGQVKTSEKSNEITAIPELLELLELSGSVVTIDAMGCQKKIASKIIEKGADYILAVKENQEALYKEITTFFDRHKALGYQGRGYDFLHYEETEKGHGRIETRKCTSIDQISWMYEAGKWKKLTSIAMIESMRIINGIKSKETRYYITSLSPEPKHIASGIRSHWGIENSLHWVLDVTFNEDQSRIRKGNAPQNIATIKHVALNMIKNAQKSFKGTSIKALRKAAAWNNNTMSVILGLHF
jgi:predicted transposase YbfD/YdcC